jgi:uncharacterized membrane protein
MIKLQGSHNGIPWRRHEISRIEALSDAVFALAITLLIVSLEVPQTFAELWEKMHGLVAFAICFALLFQVWYTQHTFFRRYGLEDLRTVVLNGALLFLVLFYMYPLKFLFVLLSSEFLGGHGLAHLADGRSVPMIASSHEATLMMIIYSVGFSAIFGIFVLLYANALKKRSSLGLSAAEVFDARTSLIGNAIMVGVAALSLLVLFTTRSQNLSGFTYFLIPIAQQIFGTVRGRKRRLRFETLVRTQH